MPSSRCSRGQGSSAPTPETMPSPPHRLFYHAWIPTTRRVGRVELRGYDWSATIDGLEWGKFTMPTEQELGEDPGDPRGTLMLTIIPNNVAGDNRDRFRLARLRRFGFREGEWTISLRKHGVQTTLPGTDPRVKYVVQMLTTYAAMQALAREG